MNKFVGALLLMGLAVSFAPDAVAQCQLAPATLVGPTQGTVPFGPITLQWSPVPNAATYEPFISIDNDPPHSLGLTTGTAENVVVDPGRFVQWKVRANAPNCASSESQIASFTTSCPTSVPDILTPAPGAQFQEGASITFSWQGVIGAVSYDVYVTPDFGATFELLVENHPTRSYTAVLPKGDWGWYVRANYDGQCPPGYSQPSHFLVGQQQGGGECDDRTPPTLISPPDNATVTLPVTFEWQPTEGATAYDVFIVVGDDLRLIGRTTGTSVELDHGITGTVQWAVVAEFADPCRDLVSEKRTLTIEGADECEAGEAVPIAPANGATNLSSPVTFRWRGVNGATAYRVLGAIGSNELDILGTTTGTTLTADVPAGSGYWVVQTIFGDNCPSTISDRFTLTVTSGAACDETGPTLVSPANNAVNVGSPVVFDWNAVKNAKRYALFVATSGDDFEFYGTTEETELEAFVPDGLIRWFVVATFAGCPEARSSIFTFTAGTQDNCPGGTIALQSPAQNATVPSPVTLSWSAVAGVQLYRLTILIDGETPLVRRTANTQETLELPAGEHRWYAEGLREDCEPIVSDEGTFVVARGANCDANQAPTLVSPAGTENDPTIVTSPVTFSWNASNGAIAYRLWVSRNGNAFEDIGVTAATQATIPLPPGVYGWYLEGVFRGCDPIPSAIAYFAIAETEARCPSEGPIAISPIEGSTVPAPIHFSWTEVRRAARYRVFVSFNGSEERLIGVTTETELTRVLPPGDIVYRIEAEIAECPSVSSAAVAFTIPEAANCSDEKPDLLTPANGSTLTEQEVDFAWTPVSGAVRYVVLAQTADGSRVPVGETTETSFSRRMPYGEIAWSVVAFFAGCDPQESAQGSFTIAPPQNCPTRAPILLMPSQNTPEVVSPVTFAWTRVPGATIYQIWVPQGSPLRASVVAETTENLVEVDLPPGNYQAFVTAKFANCPSTESAIVEFTVSEPVPCGTPEQPEAHVVGQALSGTAYRLRWSPLANVDLYEVQESLTAGFENAETFTASQPAMRFQHENNGPPVQYFYRVRGISNCDDSRGPFSEPVAVFIIAPRTNNSSAEVGVEDTIVQTVVLPPQNPPLQFVARVDKPWLTVTPATGTVGSQPVTLTVTADPGVLVLGTNTGTVRVEYTTPPSGNVATHATTTVTVPISVSLVTPITPSGKGTPPPDALIFPIVGHAAGVNDSLFESDIRIANLTPQTMKYQVNFTPSGTDGTQTGSSTTIEVPPNTTTALDDIVASVFGTGTTSSALGMLEVRPLTTTGTTSTSIFSSITSTFPALTTAASSRTYNFTPNGTFGQYIPAIPFSKFAGKGTILSLLQVAQSTAYRANFGFTEAAGAPVDLMVRVYDTKSTLLATIPVSLGATQHVQLNGMLAANGINDLADGRVEVEVVNGNGKVTAYVSEIDNKTNDPLLVNAVPKAATSANRYVVPGMAYIDNGFAFWVSDLRIFNAGTTSTPATVTFYPQGNGTPVSRDITLDAGEIEVLDNVVANLFGQPNGAGGAIAITTPANTRLSATARTYNQTANGTYGQFIPGVTVAESVGAADRALQLLQLETSSRMRTNVGVSETSGQPVTVEITAIQPDSIVTPVITLDLAPNEFRQISLADFFDAGAAVYNARVTVKVISGTGRVTAYGSAIDVITQDPTYVPAL